MTPNDFPNLGKRRKRIYIALAILLLFAIGIYNVVDNNKQEQVILKDETVYGR